MIASRLAYRISSFDILYSIFLLLFLIIRGISIMPMMIAIIPRQVTGIIEGKIMVSVLSVVVTEIVVEDILEAIEAVCVESDIVTLYL